jgi:peroxiredoxin Q/BCP|tara:strand:+ start:751 stop:1215 length:465 start_codon:yes stop_codon:yes gene_type:complete
MILQEGDQLPNLTLLDQDSKKFLFSSLRGKKAILYFYPKDSTPGCTREACDFQQLLAKLTKNNCVVLGISKDTPDSHVKFRSRQKLKFTLLSDVDGGACKVFGTWVKKSMYGRKFMGIERSTFLIDEEGKISKIWRKVKVTGHAEEVFLASRDI